MQGYAVYFLAAVLPAVILMFYIFQKDKVEKEPVGLLLRLIFGGVLAALASVFLETIGIDILNEMISPLEPAYVIFLAFTVVATAEEFTKFFFMKLMTWRHPAFNYRFDGTVYAVFTSLGFAAYENIGYVFGYGIQVAPARAILSIPGHMSFAVFMGYYYGRAKLAYDLGRRGDAFRLQVMGLLIAILLHGFYDACAMMQTSASSLVFLVFIVLLDIRMLRTVSREARTDRRV